jgi:hypothetical protein
MATTVANSSMMPENIIKMGCLKEKRNGDAQVM